MSKSISPSLPSSNQNYQNEDDLSVVDFKRLCDYIRKFGSGTEVGVAWEALQLLNDLMSPKSSGSFSNYITQAKPVLERIKQQIGTNQNSQGSQQQLSHIVKDIRQSHYAPSFGVAGKSSNWLGKVQTTIQTLPNMQAREKALVQDIRSPLMGFNNLGRHFQGLNQSEKNELKNVADRAIVGKFIDKLSCFPAAIHIVVSKAFKVFLWAAYSEAACELSRAGTHSYEEIMQEGERAFSGKNPEFNKLLKEMAPHWAKKIVRGFSYVDKKLDQFDTKLHQRFYSTEGIVREAGWGLVDIGFPTLVGLAGKGVKNLSSRSMHLLASTSTKAQSTWEGCGKALSQFYENFNQNLLCYMTGNPGELAFAYTLMAKKAPEYKFGRATRSIAARESVNSQPLFSYAHRSSYDPVVVRMLEETRAKLAIEHENLSAATAIYHLRESLVEYYPIKNISVQEQIYKHFPKFSQNPNFKFFESDYAYRVSCFFDKKQAFVEKALNIKNPDAADLYEIQMGKLLCEAVGIDFVKSLKPTGLWIPDLFGIGMHNILNPYLIKSFTPGKTISETLRDAGQLALGSSERKLMIQQLAKVGFNGAKGAAQIAKKGMQTPAHPATKEQVIEWAIGGAKTNLTYAERALGPLGKKLPESIHSIHNYLTTAFMKNPGELSYAFILKYGADFTIIPDSCELGMMNPYSITGSYDGLLRPISHPAKQFNEFINMMKVEGLQHNLTPKEIGLIVRSIEDGYSQMSGHITPEALHFYSVKEKLSTLFEVALKSGEGGEINVKSIDLLLEDLENALKQVPK